MPASAKGSRGEERRRLILSSTMRVIADEGLDAVTHRRVAQVAGISFGSISYWFDSRRSLIDAAFRSYLDGVSALLDELEREAEGRSVGDVINLLVEIERRSFEDAHVILAEYELVLAAARDSELARAFVAWERLVIGRLAEALESLGAPRPFEAARTVLQLMRGSELDRLTRPEAGDDEFRARLEVLIPALLSHAAHEDATVVRAPSTTTTAPATARRDQHTGGPRAHRTPRSKR